MSNDFNYLGKKEYLNGNYEKAIECFNKAIVKSNNNIDDIYHFISLSYQKKKEFNNSIKYIISSIKIDPNNSKYWIILGELLDDIKKYEKSIIAYKRAVELNPNNIIDSIITRIQILEEINKTDSEDSDDDFDNNEVYLNHIEKNTLEYKLFNNIKNNKHILEKLNNKHIQNKLLNKDKNPFELFNDNDILNLMKDLYKEFKKFK